MLRKKKPKRMRYVRIKRTEIIDGEPVRWLGGPIPVTDAGEVMEHLEDQYERLGRKVGLMLTDSMGE
ncbi:MAG: hypothetical protein GWO44_01330 [Thermoplasmata archaeon]|nr:hypothetical protein [Thermoplasmata archaeon]NIY01935.1 hypothetical protein [Thermoplasmata archaeon]